jgi:hypothetical protein
MADVEGFMQKNRMHSRDDDDADGRYPTESGCSRDRTRKCKDFSYEEADGTEMITAGFSDKRNNTDITTATEAAAAAIAYRKGECYCKQCHEWKPRRPRDDAPSPAQVLADPYYDIHFYIDSATVTRS